MATEEKAGVGGKGARPLPVFGDLCASGWPAALGGLLPCGLPVPPSLGHSTQTAFRSQIPERKPEGRVRGLRCEPFLFCSGLFSSPRGLSPPVCPKHRSFRNKSKVILCLYFCLSIHLSCMDSKRYPSWGMVCEFSVCPPSLSGRRL